MAKELIDEEDDDESIASVGPNGDDHPMDEDVKVHVNGVIPPK